MNNIGFKKIKIARALLISLAAMALLWFPSCKDEPFEYKVDRASALSFRLDTFDIVTTPDVSFSYGPNVLYTFPDTSQVLFQRISLQAYGMTPGSKEFWFVVDFDTHADGNAVGVYRSSYDKENGGINDMRLIINDNGKYLEFKALPDQNEVYFQVDAQRPEERIMKGIFAGVLYENGDPAGQAVYLYDGTFKDIYY